VYAVQNMAPPPLCPTSPALPVDEEAQASVDAIRRIASFKGGVLRTNNLSFWSGGDVYQFGVAAGNSLSKVLAPAVRRVASSQLWGFDSFDGVPAEEAGELTAWTPGVYRQALPEQHMANLTRNVHHIVGTRLQFVRGLFVDSLTPRLACERGMRPALYLDIDCDIFSGARDALGWAFSQGIVRVGTVIGYDDWWVMPCSSRKPDVFATGEGKAHKLATTRYGVEFECLAGPCRYGVFAGANRFGCTTSLKCWRPYFVVRAIGSTTPSLGFSMDEQQVLEFLNDRKNKGCQGAKSKNPVGLSRSLQRAKGI